MDAFALLVLGASGIIGQIVLLRELLVVFSGNELSVGIILGDWLALEAAGCFLAGRLLAADAENESFAAFQAGFAALLPAALAGARLLRPLLGVPAGEAFGLGAMLAGSALVLAAPALLHGALFAAACRRRAGGFVYGWETLGSLAGGAALSFWLLPRLHAFAILWLVAAVDLAVCARLSARAPRRLAYGAAALVLAAAFGPGAGALQKATLRAQWPGQDVLFYGNSAHGNVTVLAAGGQSVFLTDGTPAVVEPVPDIESVEELAHIPLLAHPAPRDVLVLGGGAGGLLREVLKHPVRGVDYAELDPLLLGALQSFPSPMIRCELGDPRLRVRRVDGRLWAGSGGADYDAIIVGARGPSSLQGNRLFTEEFFKLAARRLRPGGILAFGLPGSAAALEDNLADINASIAAAAAAAFPRLRAVPGERNLFMASDSADFDAAAMARRLRERRIKTGLVTPEQLAFKLDGQWTGTLDEALARRTGRNADLRPLAVFFDLAHANARLWPPAGRLLRGLARLPAAAAVLVLLPLLAWRRRRPAAACAVAATGFSGMLLSMSLLFAFQALYGCVYLWIGVLSAAFMAGAGAAGLL
ncbi:MAG: spermine synthase, partial [Elusimicrobia bacterium]|nr:spermine synthase [Elusimicrobiota bacterium]